MNGQVKIRTAIPPAPWDLTQSTSLVKSANYPALLWFCLLLVIMQWLLQGRDTLVFSPAESHSSTEISLWFDFGDSTDHFKYQGCASWFLAQDCRRRCSPPSHGAALHQSLLLPRDSLPQVCTNLGISAGCFIVWHNHVLCLVITVMNCLWRC